MNEGMVLERDAARDLAVLERDIEVFACYWERRKERFLDEVWEEFSLRVQPRAICDAGSLPHDIAFMNVAMTEWFLFERAYQDGLTPLEFYVEHGLEGIAGDTADRLRQVARTQLFSRFAICEKDAASGRVELEDTRSRRRYDVYDPRLCEVPSWRKGVIAERIALVDGGWQMVGHVRLYDRAAPRPVTSETPGEVHGGDEAQMAFLAHMGFYLRLLRDTIGMHGWYRGETRVVGKC